MKQEKIISLIPKVQKGDQSACDEFFGLIYNDVYYFALKTVNNEDTAADITQESLITIYKNINDLRDPVAFTAWSRQITYFQCTRYFRKKKEVLLDNDDEEGSLFDTLKEDSAEFIPEELMEKKHFRETVMNFINSLSAEQRSAVMMYYFEELSVGDIAKIQGVSEGTVKSRLNYARKAIKQMVEDYERATDTKLHAIPFIPFIRWIFSSEKATLSLPVSAEAAISAATASASATATTAATAATAVSAGTTAAANAVGASIVAKIAIGAVALATLIGVTVGVMNYVKDDEDDDDREPKNTYVMPMTDEDGKIVVGKLEDITKKPQTEKDEPEQPALKEEYEDVIIGNVRYVYDDGVRYSTTYVYDRYASLQGESWEAIPASYEVDPTVTELTILSEINGCPVQVRNRPEGEKFGDRYPNLKKVEVDCWYVDLGGLACAELETLAIGSNVKYVEDSSSEPLPKLKNITILPGNQRFAYGVFMYTPFYNDESNWQDHMLIVDGVLLDTNRKSGWNAIYVIPEGVTNVADGAFSSSSGPTPADDIIYIPSTLTKGLEWSDISNCINVYISPDNPVYRIENSCLINYRDKIFLKAGDYQVYHRDTYQYYEEGNSISYITLRLSSETMIPSDGSVMTIGADAFRDWNAYADSDTLTVVIPNTITKIEEGAFSHANVNFVFEEGNPLFDGKDEQELTEKLLGET